MSSDYAISGDHGSQLALPGMAPEEGTTWRNIHTGAIGVIIKFEQRAYAWVTVRRDGHDTQFPLHQLHEHWRPCRPDGTPR